MKKLRRFDKMVDVVKKMALAKFLELDEDEIEDIEKRNYNHYGLTVFVYGDEEYAIGTDEEADRAVKEYIRNSVWAFNTEFILSHCDLPFELAEAIRTFQATKCEGANDALLALIEKCGDFDKFVEEAVEVDGRGHFLSPYDGVEHEVEYNGETYYIYRL